MPRQLPDFTGFDVVIPPPIQERLRLPWDHEFSIPKRHKEEDKTYYIFKPRVHILPNGYWRIDIDGIVGSELSDTYATQQIAFKELHSLIKQKGE